MAAEPSLAEHACLALVVQGVAHGWALGTLLAPDGEIGRVYSVSRPLTYRAVDQLVARKLLRRRGSEPGQGRERTLLAPTAAGRRVAAAWLDEPVRHVRDVRTELLLKLVLRERAGLAREAFLGAQRDVLAPLLDALIHTDAHDVVALWRRESARAVRRFLDEALREERGIVAVGGPAELRLSARNQLRGHVTAVTLGEVMASVKVVLPDGQQLTAAVTKESVEDLDVAAGDPIVVIVKATEVILAKPR